MKLIRWPALCLMLLCLLAGFFIVGQAGNTVVRTNLEAIASNEFGAQASVGSLDLSVFGSYIAAEDLALADPADAKRAVFAARHVGLYADLARFFERRALIKQAVVDDARIVLFQTQHGSLAFMSEQARLQLAHEPASVRLNRILTWTTDQINPMKAFPAMPAALIPSGGKTALDTVPVLDHGAQQEAVVRGFRLRLPRDYPDLLLKELSVNNALIELVPFSATTGLVLHAVSGSCTELSTNPQKNPEPVRFITRGFIGEGTSSWFAIAGTVDLFAGGTNLFIDFSLNNMPVSAALPFARTYTRILDMLAIQSGFLTARGHVQLVDGVVQPSTVKLRAEGFTANAHALTDATGRDLGWLRFLSVSNSMIEAVVPIDAKKPYFHVDEAIKKQDVKVELKNIEFKINLGKDGTKALDGLFDKDILKKGLR